MNESIIRTFSFLLTPLLAAGLAGVSPGTNFPAAEIAFAPSARVGAGAASSPQLLPMQPARRATKFVSPSGADPVVTREYYAPTPNWLPGHRGVDLEFAEGGEVYAASDGVVIYAGLLVDRNLVSIEHSGGIRTSYEPVDPVVRRGEHVRAGQLIGYAEAGHTDKHFWESTVAVHFGARRAGKYIDPLSLLRHREIRLY